MKYKAIIFDWDGTLMDSIDKIVACVKVAASDCQLSVPTNDAIRHIIGLSLDRAMLQLFPTATSTQQAAMVDAYRHYYATSEKYETPLYPGIEQWLNALKEQGYILAVATGKGRNGLNRMLDNFSMHDLFAVTYCADETASKPDPLMLNCILEKLNLDASQALMVGDTSYDLEMAINAGMDCMGVSYGVHSKESLHHFNPIAIVDDLPKEFSLYV